MEVVETHEVGGELRGRTRDGAQVRWDPNLGRWVSHTDDAPSNLKTDDADPFASPWRASAPIAEQPTGGSTIEDGPSPSSNPVDQAFNRAFPPFSRARLVLGIILLPLFALIQFGWRWFRHDEDFSVAEYLLTLTAGILVLALVFGYEWWKRGTFERETGISEERLRRFWRFRLDPLNDMALSSVLFFIGLAGSSAMMDFRMLSPLVLLILIAASVGAATMLYFRAWILIAVVLSALIGAGVAIFVTLFATFMGGNDNFWINWAVVFGIVFLFLGPAAWAAKRKFESLDLGRRLPTFLIAAASCLLLLLIGVFGFFSRGEAAGDSAGTFDGPSGRQTRPGATHEMSSAMSPRIAAQQLFVAWRSSSIPDAQKVASPDVVASLLAIPYANQSYRGCGVLKGTDDYRCVIETEIDLILLKALRSNAGFYVGGLDHVPKFTEVDIQN